MALVQLKGRAGKTTLLTNLAALAAKSTGWSFEVLKIAFPPMTYCCFYTLD
jgi:cellulose biosynthesis protein BcsQ